jgi:hypothetical protein
MLGLGQHVPGWLLARAESSTRLVEKACLNSDRIDRLTFPALGPVAMKEV